MKELIIFSGEFSGGSPLPFASGGVKAGFPVPRRTIWPKASTSTRIS